VRRDSVSRASHHVGQVLRIDKFPRLRRHRSVSLNLTIPETAAEWALFGWTPSPGLPGDLAFGQEDGRNKFRTIPTLVNILRAFDVTANPQHCKAIRTPSLPTPTKSHRKRELWSRVHCLAAAASFLGSEIPTNSHPNIGLRYDLGEQYRSEIRRLRRRLRLRRPNPTHQG
jgi:hypothetical protein